MRRTSSLIAGRAARQVHDRKSDGLLNLTFKVHIVTSSVVKALYGSTSSNASRLLQQLERKGLLQLVQLRYCEHAPRGRGYMLTAQGVTRVTRDDFEPSHIYNTKPESVRQIQLEHDLVAAQIAAAWIKSGGELLQTDYMARQEKTAAAKIPDLIVRDGSDQYRFEYERLTKSDREIDQMLLASIKSTRTPTFWLCGTRGCAMRIQKVIDAREVTGWKLNTSNKWTRGATYFVPFAWRSKQVVLHAPLKEVLDYDIPKWKSLLQDTLARESTSTVQAWVQSGWRWSEVRTGQHDDTDQGFRLRRDSDDQQIEVAVCLANEQWWVTHLDEPFDRGLELKGRTEPVKEIGKVPPVALIESAIRAIACNPDFFQ